MEEQPELWEPLEKSMKLHPKYFAKYKETVEHIFYGDYGPLPVSDRHFIAIMAASRHSCQFMVELHSQEFLRLGGEDEWLGGGLEGGRVPQKILNLDHLNRLLAHQPWIISFDVLKDLLRCSSPSNWSLSELIHGAVILNHTHAVCSFIKGCGIVSSQPPSPSTLSQPGEEGGGVGGEVAVLMERMEALKQSAEESSQEEKAKHFAAVNIESSNLAPTPLNGAVSIASPSVRYTDDTSFHYIDFVKRLDPSETPTFKIHDYSWEDHGYSVVNQVSSTLSNLLDEKFRLIKSLTYYTMGDHEGVDTTKYRIAVWNYIQSLYGIRHDDYDYAEVNQLVSRQMKTFIKTLCCFPSQVSEKMRSTMMVDFQHSEKVHVLLLILEARFQSELLYFLRSVSRFLLAAPV